MKNKSGVTLVELIIVVFILGTMATVISRIQSEIFKTAVYQQNMRIAANITKNEIERCKSEDYEKIIIADKQMLKDKNFSKFNIEKTVEYYKGDSNLKVVKVKTFWLELGCQRKIEFATIIKKLKPNQKNEEK